ncbi:hypothetical protein MMC20_004569 [Loxospora ochrophaea]|nr:hypothetical protein [Loxospora ochrophaea]
MSLWVEDWNDHIFAHLIGTGVDITSAGSFPWTVEIPPSELSITDEWVFRIAAAGATPPFPNGENASPGFLVSNDTSSGETTSTTSSATVASATTTPSATATVTSSSTSTISNAATVHITTAPTATPTGATPASLSAGTKAGIAIGTIVGAFALIGTGWMFAQRRHKLFSTTNRGSSASHPDGHYPEAQQVGTQVFPKEATHPVEIYTGPEIPPPPVELDQDARSRQSQTSELDGRSYTRGF